MRKIIQIIKDGHTSIALCDDGTVWKLEFRPSSTWEKLPDIPQTNIKF